ncbi:MAG: c-type cytochrome [Proteobacteria bacterium]|nr:c-type cytochrome [Pseudomonadota bacterium]
MTSIPLLALVFGCTDPEPVVAESGLDPDRYDHLFGTELGAPLPGLDEDTALTWMLGRGQFKRDFSSVGGLGPVFNSDSCANCHGSPVVGGAGALDRDVWLMYADGEPAGTNGVSAVKALYSIPALHQPDPLGVTYIRRNAPTVTGVGLLAQVEDADILANADPDDADGDGISGRANTFGEAVGRFGWKAQLVSLDEATETCAFNQQGLTMNTRTDLDPLTDPEIDDEISIPLAAFLELLAPAAQLDRGPTENAGCRQLDEMGCTGCHLPELPSPTGPLPAWTDLLLHDMGAGLEDGVEVGEASGAEFRTPPLWGVAAFGPWLHDGSADTLDAAILAHGGEAAGARQAYADATAEEQAQVLAFLESLGQAPEPVVRSLGELGGPTDEAAEDPRWPEVSAVFAAEFTVEDGLGPELNATTCGVCHMDQAPGGAGGVDADVIWYGSRDGDEWVEPDPPMVHRAQLSGDAPFRLPSDAEVVELRTAPTLMGLGEIAGIPDEAILALADPDDADGDGVIGIPSILEDGSLGRFGWQAQVSSLEEMVRLELATHHGVEADEPGAERVDDLVLFIESLAPALPRAALDEDGAARGELLFVEIGCTACHVQEIAGVTTWSDLLLHDMGGEPQDHIGDLPGWYRTAPLVGVGSSYPYGHDGMDRSPMLSLQATHGGEATTSMSAWSRLTESERSDVIFYLLTL